MLKKFNILINDNLVVVLGSGGASKAIVQYLLENGTKAVLISRNKEEIRNKYKELNIFDKINVINYDDLTDITIGSIIINTTPCGMYPNINNSVFSGDILKNFKTAIDIIYNSEKTLFLSTAESKGLNIVNGLYMLVTQAIKSEEIWNNIKIDYEIIDKIYNVLLIEHRSKL